MRIELINNNGDFFSHLTTGEARVLLNEEIGHSVQDFKLCGFKGKEMIAMPPLFCIFQPTEAFPCFNQFIIHKFLDQQSLTI